MITRRRLLVVSLLALGGTVHAGQLSEAEVKTLKEEARKVGKAFDEGDIEAIMNSTHPSIFKLTGDPEKFKALTTQALKTIKEMKVVIEERKLGEPAKTYEAGEEEVCFLPQSTVMTIGEQRVKGTGFLVAIRKKPDGKWLFLDGAGMRRNPDQLWTLLPELPKDVELPPNTMEVEPAQEGDEQ